MPSVAIVGATGAVGQAFERVLHQRRFPANEYRLLASERSAGQSVAWCGQDLTVSALTHQSFAGIDIAFFSAGGSISREFAPVAVKAGAVVIDNSSAFRMDADVPLIVPEINPQAVSGHSGIIANPNCSTIIMVLPIWPLHLTNTVRRVNVCTYQAASGAGARALAELESQTRLVLEGGEPQPGVFPVPCAFNVFSHNSALNEDGHNYEESKMVAETRKIFGNGSIGIAATCMRVPVPRAHLEAVSVEFADAIDPAAARETLERAPGVRVIDDRQAGRFPTSRDATGIDEVLVGRIRRDPSIPGDRGLQFICAGDQLLKGAALNAVQIAELLIA
jgi:aspartate-semialdehyde dehydrogenase